MPNRYHVELDLGARSNEALAAHFDEFARFECAAPGIGSGALSPTYAVLSRHVAGNAALLALARECRVGQPIPNLLFAAVKYLLWEEPGDRLAELYARAARGEEPSPDLPLAFEAFCARHARAILDLVRKRSVQTNEVGRCAFLMPAFGVVARHARRHLAIVDVGASAGLNLLWDRFDYRYSDGSEFGAGSSPVRIECVVCGRMPRIPVPFPKVASRVGIDMHPLDLGDEDQYRWLQALVWPDRESRSARLAAARRIWLQHRPRVVSGDALTLLPLLIAETPRDAALCVIHTHVLNQFPVDARCAFSEILRSASHSRPVYRISAEGHDLAVTRHARGDAITLLSARRCPHGRWVDWQPSGSGSG